MKYIDAEKLIVEINNRLMSVNLEKLGNFGCHRIWAYNDVKDLITHLQQEKKLAGKYRKDGYEDVAIEKIEQKPTWSEEDEKILGKCIDAASGYYLPEDKQSIKDWLRHLKGRIVLQPQPKQEWSEKDEKILDSILNDLLQDAIPDDEDIQWLKSLKERMEV